MVGGGGEAGAHSTSPTYTVRKDRPARDPSSSALWLQKPSILRVCVREEDAGGGGGRVFVYYLLQCYKAVRAFCYTYSGKR